MGKTKYLSAFEWGMVVILQLNIRKVFLMFGILCVFGCNAALSPVGGTFLAITVEVYPPTSESYQVTTSTYLCLALVQAGLNGIDD